MQEITDQMKKIGQVLVQTWESPGKPGTLEYCVEDGFQPLGDSKPSKVLCS